MSKVKRPEKMQPSMGLNGVNGGAPSVSTSPSLPAKKPPPILPPTSGTSNGGTVNGISRTAARPRRDAPSQLLGRGQRTAGAGLKSASMVADMQVVQASQPPPYIRSDSYILKKYRGCPASLIVHLHPTHFRFDQQDGTFSYKSPMKIFIEHLRSGTVPQDLLEFFTMWNITFYEGCLIVEVHDHKSIATARESSQNSSNNDKTEPMSIHNYNAYLTPSPWVPYPKENLATLTKNIPHPEKLVEADKAKAAEDKDKENMPAPGQPSDTQRGKVNTKKAKISTVVLHPTPLSDYIDLTIKATTPLSAPSQSHHDGSGMPPMSAAGPRPQTPMLAIPSTPNLGMDPPPAKRVKREKMVIDAKNIYQIESQITLATTAPLFLDPVESAGASAALLEILAHPEHSFPVPSPKSRKKTVAEMAAEESAAADEEQYMLILDDRYNNGAAGGAAAADGDGQVGGASFEPRFERFKAIESIKLQVIENKKREKLQQAEAAKKQQQESEARERVKQEANKREQEELARMRIQQQQQQQQNQRQQQEAHRRQMAQTQAQNQQAMKGIQAAGSHGHPTPNMVLQNAAMSMASQQQRFMQQQQQLSQAPMSSPVVRNATPHNVSSPMVPPNMGLQLQRSTSSLGGSPQRPGSVVPQNPQMTPVVAHAMRAQGSQQSHVGTPRSAHATPNMVHDAQRASQTPRMSQTSPMPGHMIQAPQMGGAHMMPNTLTPAQMQQQAQIIAQQQHQQQRMRQQAAQHAMSSSPVNGQQLTPQQIAMQQQQFAQQQMQQGNAGMMAGGNQINYTAQMRAMAAAAQQNALQQQNAQGFMGRGAMTPQMVQQAQHQAAMQAQQQGQPNIIQQRVQSMTQQLYQSQINNFLSRFPAGQVPQGALNSFKQQCHANARQRVQQVMMQQQQNAMRQQQQQGQMAAGQQHPGMGQGMNMAGNMGMNMGMPGNMNGNMNANMSGMGIPRPSGI